MRGPRLFALVCLVPLSLSASGCAGPGLGNATWVRGQDAPGVERAAMSSRLDRRDLQKVFNEQVSSLISSPFYVRERMKAPNRTIAIVPIHNRTNAHIDSTLDALSSWVETQLVADQAMRVVSLENHPQILGQIRTEQSAVFDSVTAARFGRLLGVNYVVAGKVQYGAERTDDMRRSQYYLHLQVIEVETGTIRWQASSDVTKALVAL